MSPGTSRQRRHQFNETTATISGLQSRSCWLGSLTSANGITLADSVKGKESPSRYSSPRYSRPDRPQSPSTQQARTAPSS